MRKKKGIHTITESDPDIQGITQKGKKQIMRSMIVLLLLTSAFAVLLIIQWAKISLDKELVYYSAQLNNWVSVQLRTMNLFTDMIEANPSMLQDYDETVEYLDRIVSGYPEISAAYIACPKAENKIIMNNGWVPEADYVLEEREWYLNAIESESETQISTLYVDARTGSYCLTFSRAMYDVSGEQIGVFALDFCVDSLIDIVGGGNVNIKYAFLVDRNNRIVNHINSDYQMTAEKAVNIENTEYNGAQKNGVNCYIESNMEITASKTDEISGFTVIVVESAIVAYGLSLLYGSVFIIALLICVMQIYKLIMRVVLWQEKASQVLREESEKAKRADNAKSTFLAQMSHEIRTPINAVLGMNEMILKESKEETILEYASNAYNSGKTLLSIINDVLDISKIEAGKMEITETDYDLYSLINDCYHMTADRARKKGLAFTYVIDKNLPSRLIGDMFHVRQIVVNFITNAIKYTDEGSVELAFNGKQGDSGFVLQVSVKDTGIGLTEESKSALFTSFQRFDLKRNQSVEGTGLGLAICKQLAELMGGSVGVESEYGKGSIFTFTVPQGIGSDIPLGEVTLEHQTERQYIDNSRKYTAQTAHILIVDDVEMNLIVLESLVKEHKFMIDRALSGEKCLELVQKYKYDIIFMDHMMPGMDGMETFDHMRKMEHLNKDSPVIMLTANAISGEKDKYLSAGFASYLTKPIQSDKLEEMLLAYLPEEKIVWDQGQPETDDRQAAEETLQEEVSALFDVNLGIYYAGGDRDAYLRILSSYLNDSEKKLSTIRLLCEQGQWKDYVTKVHALKSTSLTVGAKQLSDAALELEQAGKSGDYDLIREKNQALLSLYQEVIEIATERLRRWQEEAGGKETASESKSKLEEITAEVLEEYRERLKNSAENFDGDGILAVCEELSRYAFQGRELEGDLRKVKEAASDFEYEQAWEEAERIFKSLLA